MKQRPAPEEADQPQKTIDGPGSQLRKARERQGLDQAKVAAQLHLNQALIQALEWDDYERLPAAVFVKGYLRNYARLLGLNEDAVIEAFQQLQPDVDKQPLPRNQPDEVAKDLHKGPRLGAYMVSGVVVLVAIMIFFWWQGQLEEESTARSTGDEEQTIEPAFAPDEPDGLASEQEMGLPPIGSGVTPRPEVAPPPPAVSTPDPSIPALVPAEPASAEEIEQDVSQAVIEPQPLETRLPEIEVLDTEEPGTEALATEETPIVAPVVTSDVVEFEFSGPCWVEVRDANGRARLIGMMRDGTRRRLDTQLGPFRVVIGDIQVARLSVRGQAYDLSRHTRGKVARFTLDPSRL
jgi:cytoskeleton protein RodZ